MHLRHPAGSAFGHLRDDIAVHAHAPGVVAYARPDIESHDAVLAAPGAGGDAAQTFRENGPHFLTQLRVNHIQIVSEKSCHVEVLKERGF